MVPIQYRQTTEKQFAAIGKFIVQFSGLESSIKLGISLLAPLPDDASIELLAGYDFAMACTVLDVIGQKRLPTDASAKLQKYLKIARHLNDERVKVAHGSWQTLGEFQARHVSRQKLKTSEHFKDEAELVALAEEADHLGFLIFGIYFEHVDAT